MTAEIERILKVDYGLFYRAIYAEQNRMDYFLELDPRERKRQFDELLGIDRFEAARANAGTAMGFLKRAKEVKEKELAGIDFAELSSRVEGGKERAEAARLELARAHESAAAAREAEAGLREKFSGLERAKKGFDALAERKAGLEHTLAVLKSEVGRRRDALGGEKVEVGDVAREVASADAEEAGLKEKLREASAKLSSLRERECVLSRDLRELELLLKRRAELEKALSSAPGGVAGAKARLQELEAAREESVEELALARARGKECEKSLSELEASGCNCPVCEREIGAELRAKLAAAKKKEAAELSVKSSAFERRLKDFGEKIPAAEKAFRDAEFNSKRAQEIGDVSGKAEEAKEALGKNSASLSAGGKACSELDAGLEPCAARAKALREKLTLARELQSSEARASAAAGELEEARKLLAETRFDQKTFDSVRAEIERRARLSVEFEGRAKLLEERLKSAERELELGARELEAFEKRRREAKSFEAALESAAVLQAALVETQAALRTELVEAVNEAMGELWPAIYPYDDFSGARIDASETDYLVEVKAGGSWIPVEGFASGGERACALLSLRISFAMVIVPNLKWLVLDEPTHNLDGNGIKALVEALREKIPSIVEQVFVITHDESLREAASGRVYRLERDKGGAGPTTATAIG
ncbi:DNA double-strand break repair Rad50 ATPase [uncultured archaeon]|nr:DNA double-strand break repair Rad50 ATPase [uncultured archaeon]